jgi:peptidoglycan hydrolase-like protein with peptidoglycan-binding domain
MTYVSRLTRTAKYHNLLNVRTVDIFFQKSPGWDSGEGRGIGGLEYQVLNKGDIVQTGKTGDDGKIPVPVAGGASELQLMFGGSSVASYQISIRDTPWEANNDIAGVQRRLRTLGYQLGHAGAGKDGIDGKIGEEADKAIQDFQIDNGLPFDGRAGEQTRAKLDEKVGGTVPK